MNERTTGTVGHGTTVHFLTKDGAHRPLCGSGQNTIGTRKSYCGRVTGQPVTCKKCLAEAEKRNQLADFVAMVDKSESQSHVNTVENECLENLIVSISLSELLAFYKDNTYRISYASAFNLFCGYILRFSGDEREIELTTYGRSLVEDYLRRKG